MNDFDRKWQRCVARARQVPAEPCPIPLGFASRAIVGWRAETGQSMASLWLKMGLRVLSGATILLVLSMLLELHAAKSGSVFIPHVEDAVAQVFWML
jgi:hypothetical protein